MFHIVGNHSQAVVQGSSSNQYIEVADFLVQRLLLLLQGTANQGVLIENITDVKYGNKTTQPFWLFDMPLVVTTELGSKSQLS